MFVKIRMEKRKFLKNDPKWKRTHKMPWEMQSTWGHTDRDMALVLLCPRSRERCPLQMWHCCPTAGKEEEPVCTLTGTPRPKQTQAAAAPWHGHLFWCLASWLSFAQAETFLCAVLNVGPL